MADELEVKTFFFLENIMILEKIGKAEAFFLVTTLLSYTKTASATFFFGTLNSGPPYFSCTGPPFFLGHHCVYVIS